MGRKSKKQNETTGAIILIIVALVFAGKLAEAGILGVVLGLLFILGAIYLLKKKSDDKQTRKEPAINFEIRTTTRPSNRSQKPDQGKQNITPGKWYGKGEEVTVKGYKIPGGLIYVGERLEEPEGYRNDASLINPTLDIAAGDPVEDGERMGYWPYYEIIPPVCRGAYLSWLSGNRMNRRADIGYVFLFFYGLERRLFIDGRKQTLSENERLSITEEIKRLLEIYGDNRSFSRYAKNLLSIELILHSQGATVREFIDISDRHNIMPFKYILAKYVKLQKQIPAEIALNWFKLHPEFNLKTPARRCENEFKKLFKAYYSQRYGEGMIVKPNKKRLALEYHAASPSVRVDLRNELPDLPDPFYLAGPMKKINSVVEDCTAALDSYSRFLGRKGDSKSIEALALLPKELMELFPVVKKLKAKLESITENGPGMIAVEDIFKLFGEDTPLKINKKESRILSNLIENSGFGMAPNVEYHNIKPTSEGEIAVFPKGHGVDFSPSKEFRIVGVILRLGAMVSQIDEDLSPSEENTLKSLISNNRKLTQIEKDSLSAFLHWCIRTPQKTAGLKQSLAEVGKEKKEAISRILISVAHADGYIDPREIKQLEKLYSTLGLDKGNVTKDIHGLAGTAEPVTVSFRDPEETHKIPEPEVEKSSAQGFNLNEELIKLTEEETKEVKGVLENIFLEQEEDKTEIEETEISSSSSDTPLSSLDGAHQNLFDKLKEKEKWERDEVETICKELGLMPDGAMEVVNEWAFDNANAPLIDDGEPIYVDTELAEEIVYG